MTITSNETEKGKRNKNYRSWDVGTQYTEYSNTVWGSKIDMEFVSSAFIFILSFNATRLLA